MVSERMKALGTARSVIRELFEYGKIRAADREGAPQVQKSQKALKYAPAVHK